MDLVPRVPDVRGGVERRGFRPTPPPARQRPRVELRQDVRGPEPAAGPDRHRTRPHVLGGRPGRRREARARAPGVRGRPTGRVRPGGRRRAAGAPVGAGRSPARGVPGARVTRVATHPGNFHADDVFGVAVLELVHGDVDVVRTRDAVAQAAADARVDVGGRDDPASGDFDHHQRGGAGERSNGVRYASFGLVWRAFGAQLAGSQDAATAIDERLVQGVDANDTGQTISSALVEGIRPMTVSGVIGAMNAHWDEEWSYEQEDARFKEAVALARSILEREISGAKAYRRGLDIVRSAIERAEDPRLLELDRKAPWHETVVTTAPEALYVVYPKSDGWGMQAVPQALGEFANRKDLPEAWAGHSDAELAAITGVEDAMFAHAKRFYASARSREGILALARLALAA